MSRVFWLLFTILASSVAGAFVIAVVSTPSLAAQGKTMIPLAALCGAIVGTGLAYVIAKRIAANVV